MHNYCIMHIVIIMYGFIIVFLLDIMIQQGGLFEKICLFHLSMIKLISKQIFLQNLSYFDCMSAEYKRRWREKRKRELEFLQNTDSDTDNALHKRNCNDIRNNFEIEDVDQAGIPTSEGSSRSTSPTPSISNSNETDS
eukprot:TCONS_00039459-protein